MELAQGGIHPASLMELGCGVVVIRGHDDLGPLLLPDLACGREVLLVCQSSLLCIGWLIGYILRICTWSTTYDTDVRL